MFQKKKECADESYETCDTSFEEQIPRTPKNNKKFSSNAELRDKRRKKHRSWGGDSPNENDFENKSTPRQKHKSGEGMPDVCLNIG